MGGSIDFSHPVLFSEKMQWLKLHYRKSVFTTMVDKYAAKQYVAERIGNQYITSTIAVWDDTDSINTDSLPDKFVLKCTHDSGGLVICADKNSLDWQSAKKTLQTSLNHNYYLANREWPYKNVHPRIIAEEYLENDGSEGLHDYKIWCFNGEPEYIQYITGRIGKHTYEGFYDKSWKLQSFHYHNPLMPTPVSAPRCLDELIELARKLSLGLPFLRCDFYVLQDGSIRFGEMTFYPMSGMENWHPAEMNRIMGDKIQLPNDPIIDGE
ncbi:ATP-grasp fold amidoligase family protein [Bifidobacterium callitrichos]|nr:ATP-grasp fold amidoligase family protein [Bifidobacterium callitrichos]